MRRESTALGRGSYQTLAAIDEQELYVFERRSEKERVLVVLNAGEEKRQIDLSPYLGTSYEEWVDLERKETIISTVISCDGMQGMAFQKKEEQI